MAARTDLAEEAFHLWRRDAGETTELEGVRARDRTPYGIPATLVEILDRRGAEVLCKPVGRYATVSMAKCRAREADARKHTSLAAALLLRELCGECSRGPILVAALGNRDVTPDSVGPRATRHIFATRHLGAEEGLPPDQFAPVAVLETGVLGTTGMESAELVRAAAKLLSPSCVVAIDALAAAEPERLCASLQIADTGIVPGSGVGNHRTALNRETLGVPVIAMGVPTVIGAAALGATGAEGLIVTPRDIDLQAAEAARVVGFAINLAFHKGLTFEDAQQLTM